MKPFYIGLSRMSTQGRQALSAEGRRVLGLLDRGGPLDQEPGGRPYFTDHHADFSISHSRHMVAVAHLAAGTIPAPGGDPPRTGCDIQYADPRKSRAGISRRFFSPAEQDYIAAAPAGEGEIRRFYQIWVLKEAWIKLRGLSVLEMAKAPAFSVGAGRPEKSGSLPLDCFLYELDSDDGRYFLAAVRERGYSGERPEPELRWFSEAPPSVTSVVDIYAAQSPANTVTPKM
jgi:hypothetical protein